MDSLQSISDPVCEIHPFSLRTRPTLIRLFPTSFQPPKYLTPLSKHSGHVSWHYLPVPLGTASTFWYYISFWGPKTCFWTREAREHYPHTNQQEPSSSQDPHSHRAAPPPPQSMRVPGACADRAAAARGLTGRGSRGKREWGSSSAATAAWCCRAESVSQYEELLPPGRRSSRFPKRKHGNIQPILLLFSQAQTSEPARVIHASSETPVPTGRATPAGNAKRSRLPQHPSGRNGTHQHPTSSGQLPACPALYLAVPAGWANGGARPMRELGQWKGSANGRARRALGGVGCTAGRGSGGAAGSGSGGKGRSGAVPGLCSGQDAGSLPGEEGEQPRWDGGGLRGERGEHLGRGGDGELVRVRGGG